MYWKSIGTFHKHILKEESYIKQYNLTDHKI